MTQEMKDKQIESIETLRKMLKPGDTVYTKVNSVSRSGMSRRISLYVARANEIKDITWDVARAFGDPIKQRGEYVQDAGLWVGGYGMDMCFHTVYNLGRTLFPDGFGARKGTAPVGKEMSTDTGRGFTACKRPINREEIAECVKRGWKFYGSNGDTSGWDNDGGYALSKLDL